MIFSVNSLGELVPGTAANLAAIVVIFLGCAALEVVKPARRRKADDNSRITQNFGLGIGNMLLATILPLSSVAAAALADARDWGLFNHVNAPWWLELATLCLLLSLLSYGVHRTFHHIDWLWPLHAVHHRDQAVDLSTTFRSHPVAFLILLTANFLFTLAAGTNPLLAAIADTLLMAGGLIEHSNVRLPDRWNNQIEKIFITPRMHLVHHAREREKHDSNFGTLFSIWDHLFGTYSMPSEQEFAIGVLPRPAANDAAAAR